MADQVDLNLDSEEEDFQAAVRASLAGWASAGGSSSSSRADGANFSNSAAGMRPTLSNSQAGSSKRPAVGLSERQGVGSGKRPRSDKPPLFRLLSTSEADLTRGDSVSLADLLSGDFQAALLCNYLVDMELLLRAQPRLESVPVIIVHGDSETRLGMECAGNPGIKLHKPVIPQYGTHHTKMIILKFAAGVRFVVLTANFVPIDVTGKSQAAFYQDFPLARQRKTGSCEFEESLVDYLEQVGGPAAMFGSTLRRYDFRAARVALVASVPGTGKKKHKGKDAHKYGHMRIRALLSREKESGKMTSLEEGGHKVILQVSSLASRSPDPTEWLWELLESFMPHEEQTKMGARLAAPAKSKLLGEILRVPWPSVDAVRCSTKGWISGGAICCNTENMYGGSFKRPNMAKYRSNDPTPELKPVLRKWQGNPATNRARDAPHIKTFLRYREVETAGKDGTVEARVDGNEVAWCLLTSSNLSTSALGFLDKKASTPQLTVRSFELGVMFLPSLLGRPLCDSNEDGDGEAESLAFTCTPGKAGLTQRLPLTLRYECEPGKGLPLDLLPLPYVLPAPPYDFDKNNDDCERPWVWDQPFSPPDHSMRSWPGVSR